MKNDHLDMERTRSELLAAIKPHVPFDGWSEPAFKLAVSDLGLDPGLARVVCPRGAVDLAVAYHREGDAEMLRRLEEADLSGLKFRDRIATAVRFRLEEADPELVRRGAAIFALPQNATTGSKLIWETSDKIWRALGDISEDYNWYTKRMTLSGVYSSTVLYWMGDESEGKGDTWAFLDRRIEDVMQFEKVKGAAMKLPFLPKLLGGIRAPKGNADMPGREAQ
ncbi:ubiquinone biosynthesis protein [Thioclava sp. F42-5]|uniref:COQ9 family protein n=1 Tax=unclassified Thioclava TaxID=2621713 RepID=UPI000B540CAA|nr:MULTISPECIES: COQ9 family protein [unclassified Thioclava]OWY03581.1 ubiquinone biosynthesis protein [Thioclava sp. F1Mire-8]OWY09542.1 ubiquinone biosynthesis protein [Thioclava sp. F42-5]